MSGGWKNKLIGEEIGRHNGLPWTQQFIVEARLGVLWRIDT